MAVHQLTERLRRLLLMLPWPRGTWGDFLKRKGNPRSVSPKGCDMASHTASGVHVNLQNGTKIHFIGENKKMRSVWDG